jgi:hypothetical protein
VLVKWTPCHTYYQFATTPLHSWHSFAAMLAIVVAAAPCPLVVALQADHGAIAYRQVEMDGEKPSQMPICSLVRGWISRICALRSGALRSLVRMGDQWR